MKHTHNSDSFFKRVTILHKILKCIPPFGQFHVPEHIEVRYEIQRISLQRILRRILHYLDELNSENFWD